MIKTQTKEENKFMKRILPHYYRYMSENPSTLLVKIFGMHRVKMYHLNRKIHFVIMGSVFDTTEVIHQIFDLKGSLVGRSATAKERANGGVLKDNDLVDDGVKFHLGNKKAPFLEQIRKDAEFLATLNIMDYSLLVGIHDREKRTTSAIKRLNPAGGEVTVSGDGVTRSQTPFRNSLVGRTAEDQLQLEAIRAEFFGEEGKDHVGSDGTSSAAASPTRGRAIKRGSLSNQASPEKGVRRRRASSGDSTTHRRGSSDGTPHHHRHHRHPQCESDPAVVKTEPTPRLARASSDSEMPDGNDVVEHESGDEDDESEYYESEEEHYDEGDSDPEESLEERQARQHMFRERLSAESPYTDTPTVQPSISSKKLSPTRRPLSETVAASIQKLTSILDDGTNETSAVRPSVATNGDVDGLPEESERLSKMFRHQNTLSELSQIIGDVGAVYGPGASTRHPWTTRLDNGINCRDPVTNQRGKYIYFVGIIDILQQYNTFKRAETLYKVYIYCNCLVIRITDNNICPLSGSFQRPKANQFCSCERLC